MKTIIIYVSKYGTTKACAEKIAQGLPGEVKLVNLKEASMINLDEFSTVIIGAPIYMQKVSSDVRRFCEKNMKTLKTKKVGMFSCGISRQSEAKNQVENSMPGEFVKGLFAMEHLGGEVRLEKMNFFLAAAMKHMVKGTETPPMVYKDKIDEFIEKTKAAIGE
jgi:menaquinone-dependent protoporphyrinogen oxidase